MSRVFIMVLVWAFALVPMGIAHTAKRAYTIEDHLSLERTASARSGGNIIVWTMSPPYDEVGYYGHGINGVWDHAGASMHMAEISSGRFETEPLFESEPGVSYIIQSISPADRFVVYCRASTIGFSLGVYDRSSMSRRAYGLLPTEGGCEGESLLWLSAEEFLMLASNAERPPAVAARPYSGRRLTEERERAWTGQLSVDVQDSNPAQPAEATDETILVRINARTGVVTTLASGTFESLSRSPSGRFLAATRAKRGADRAAGSVCSADDSAGHDLLVFDLTLREQAVQVAPHLGVAVDSLNWSTTVDRLAFFACSDADPSMTVYGWDTTDRSLTRYVHSGLDLVSRRERGLYQRPERFVWIGDRIAVYARSHDGDEARFTQRNVQLFGGEDELPRADWYLVDSNGDSDNLTHGLGSTSPYVLSAGDDSMVVVSDNNIWRVFSDGESTPLTEFSGAKMDLPLSDRFMLNLAPLQQNVTLVDSGEDPAFLMVNTSTGTTRRIRSPDPGAEYIASAMDAGAVLFRLDGDDGTRLVLTHEDGSSEVLRVLNQHMAEVDRTKWETISHEVTVSGSVHRIESCILFPPGFDPGKSYPVIVDVYPTRRAHCTDPSWQKFVGIGRSPGAISAHLLAARGYIVFQPNASTELIRTADNPIGGLTSVVEQGVKELVRRGYADEGRVGLMGFSQGGFASLWLATQSSVFGAVVSLNGWSDPYVHYYDTTYLQEFYAGDFGFYGSVGRYLATIGSAFAMGRSPHEDAQGYIGLSALHRVDAISAPVLLIHSDMDMFPLHEYERMYVAMKQHEKNARLLRYWGEGHAPSSPVNIRHMWDQILEWFDRYLAGG